MPVTEPEGSFRTHWNYICALAGEAGKPAGTTATTALTKLGTTASGVLVSGFDKLATSPGDLDQVRRSLANAWSTEALVAYASEVFADDDAVRVANHWAVIQAYYVFYHLTQGLHVASGHDRPESHQKTLNLAVDQWAGRKLQLQPWGLGRTSSGWRNLTPVGPPKPGLSNLTSCSPGNQYDFVGMCLRTTRNKLVEEAERAKRDRKVADRLKAWENKSAELAAKGKPLPKKPPTGTKLSAAESASVDKKIGTTGVMHYFWRLRVKANYIDPETFTDGPTDEFVSKDYIENLRYFLAATCLVHEIRIGHLVGIPALQGWMASWAAKNSGPGSSAIGPAHRSTLL